MFWIAGLIAAGAVFAVARANYGAAWFAISSRVIEHEWGAFGKYEALVLSELFVLVGRFMVAGLLLACGASGISLRQAIWICRMFSDRDNLSSLLARFLDRRHKAQMGVV